MTDYVSDRVFDGVRPIPKERADAIRKQFAHLHTNYEDDYPSGIEADPFDPLPAPFTRTEIAIILGGCVLAGIVGYHWVLPYLRVAATAALLLASAR